MENLDKYVVEARTHLERNITDTKNSLLTDLHPSIICSLKVASSLDRADICLVSVES